MLLDNTSNESRQVLKETTAWLLTSAMQDVVNSGTGGRAKFSGMSIAGKTGTTTSNRDTLFAGSCGRTDFPGGSMEKMMASLRRLGQLEGDLRVLPGHMEASTLDRERRWNPYLLQAMQ